MLIETLTLNNFGLFCGEHVINLNTKNNSEEIKPIILFGGLNGSGKTTILTAIRLAIYGKQTLGYGVSQKKYDAFLKSKIHRSSLKLPEENFASITIDFLYFKLGKPIKYKVERSWMVEENGISEKLFIYQDGILIPEFSANQCQAFLNELIPLGVSELFFFDGEKIANLADDGGDVALRDAIRKLIGLDVIDRLTNDLHIYIRKQNNKHLPEVLKKKLEGYEIEYEKLKSKILTEEEEVNNIHPKLIEAKADLERLENSLNSKGGAWASSRQAIKKNLEKLILDKKNVESSIRDFLNGLYPISLAGGAIERLKKQLKSERLSQDWENLSSVFAKRVGDFEKVIIEYIPSEKRKDALIRTNKIFSDLMSRPNELNSNVSLHQLSSKESINLEKIFDEVATQVVMDSKQLRNKLLSIDDELANISLQIERAPDQERLQEDLDKIKIKNKLIIELTTQRNTHIELAKFYTIQSIEIIGKMRKLEDERSSKDSTNNSIALAARARVALTDFEKEITKRKIKTLEKEFAYTFSRLARKSDAIVKASIDSKTFNVNLYNSNGTVIPKQDLSAGEKQIYAVAMLEALAKTSGRKLPIIIDTPLGRLDSNHREKLINNYFPHASHQVIILSTDTEVDKNFYNDLSKNVSRAYQINYKENEGASKVEEGYFWKMKNDERVELNAT